MSRIRIVVTLLLASSLSAWPAAAQRVLFDASHGETAGNADWIVDADSSEQYWPTFMCRQGRRHHSAQRFPTPAQSVIAADSPETIWDGGISAWAVDLVKDSLRPERGRDWQIEQYPWNAPPFTFGDSANPQDLSNYDVLILCEPNVLFTDGEARSIRDFVASGGGLFLCADHETSDRNCSGGGTAVHDSPFILNRLMGTSVETRSSPPYFDPGDPANDYGEFGIWFYENGNDDSSDDANRAFDWFTEQANDNVSTDPGDPIIRGPFGDGSGGLGLFASTQMAVSTHPEKGNPSARVHIWRRDQEQTANDLGVFTGGTLVSASYGAGRVVAVGDSSPADDGTGEGSLHPGWDRASHGVANDVLFLNATEWLADPSPDVTPPVIAEGPRVEVEACRAVVTWTTDEPAGSTVEWGADGELSSATSVEGFVTGHRVVLGGLAPETSYSLRVVSVDRSGNGPAQADATVSTAAHRPLHFVESPTVTAVTATTARLAWSTDRPAVGRAAFGRGEALARTPDGERGGTHVVRLEGLVPAVTYFVVAEVIDDCGHIIASEAEPFRTAEAPAERDISGWRLVNDHPDIRFIFPEGTVVPAGGLLVIGREADRAGFESGWGPLPADTIYLNSGGGILVNSTRRAYRLLDAAGNLVDGPSALVGAGRSLRRRDGCGDAEDGWQERLRSAADPGRGAPAACDPGVVLSEVSDADVFANEFVEIYFESGGGAAPGG